MPGHLPWKSVPPVHTCRKVSARQMPVPASYLPAAFLFAIRPVTVSVPAGLSFCSFVMEEVSVCFKASITFWISFFLFPGFLPDGMPLLRLFMRGGRHKRKNKRQPKGKKKCHKFPSVRTNTRLFSMHGLPVTYARHRCAASGRYYPLFQYAHMPSRSVPETRNGRSAVLPVPWYISSLPYKCLQLPLT